MEASTFELQILIGMAVILGAALVALIVDYLATSNARLREENAALRMGGRDPSGWDTVAADVETLDPERLDDIVIGAEQGPGPGGQTALVRPIRKPASPSPQRRRRRQRELEIR